MGERGVGVEWEEKNGGGWCLLLLQFAGSE